MANKLKKMILKKFYPNKEQIFIYDTELNYILPLNPGNYFYKIKCFSIKQFFNTILD